MSGWPAEAIVETLENEAVELAGVSDFGVAEHREGLSVLISDLKKYSRLDALGAERTKATIVRTLAQRLRSESQLNTPHKSLRIARPWIILSMPRSGTTALHRLLAADPLAQGLEYWLGQYPQPRAAECSWESNEDYKATRSQLRELRKVAPGMFALHEMAADAVEECNLLMRQSFANMTFSITCTAPSYEAWHWSCDMSKAYARHRALLELIDGGQGVRWVLKDPSHLMTLDALISEYPDVRVICIKRSAEEFLPSVAALAFEARRLNEPEIDLATVGRQHLELWSRCAAALNNWHRSNRHIPWCDIYASDLLKKPEETIRRIYSAFGESLDVGRLQTMRGKLRSVKAGGSRIPATLHDCGLSVADVRAAFPPEFV